MFYKFSEVTNLVQSRPNKISFDPLFVIFCPSLPSTIVGNVVKSYHWC
jgi:hypothetical protein